MIGGWDLNCQYIPYFEQLDASFLSEWVKIAYEGVDCIKACCSVIPFSETEVVVLGGHCMENSTIILNTQDKKFSKTAYCFEEWGISGGEYFIVDEKKAFGLTEVS